MSTPDATALIGQRISVRGATEVLPGRIDRALLDVVGASAGASLQASGLWVIPGIVDAHTHLAWHAFEASEREDDRERVIDATAASLLATLRTGVTQVRDAGGYDREVAAAIAARDVPAPLVRRSDVLIGAEHAGRGAGHLAGVVAETAASGASWIKIVATGGLSSPSEAVLNPVFTRDQLLEVGVAARAAGVRIMAHAWGGPSIEWLVEAGAASIEHGIHLTVQQAALLAANDVVFVPTIAIYRQTAESGRDGRVPAVIGDRAARAADAHAAAVLFAREAGVRIALGTDAGTPDQHGANLDELVALIDVGLTPTEALEAATIVGAELLREPGEGAVGRDLVLLSVDPLRGDLTADRVVAVVQDGVLVHERFDSLSRRLADRAWAHVRSVTEADADPAVAAASA